MTTDDRRRFLAAFNRLTVALPMPADQAHDDATLAAKQETYWRTLSDLPIEAVEAAEARLRKKGSGWFPSTQEWYRVADDIAAETLLRPAPALPAGPGDPEAYQGAKRGRERLLAALRGRGKSRYLDYAAVADAIERAVPLRDPSRNPYAHWCQDCRDTGWVSMTCRHGNRCQLHEDVTPDWDEHEHVTRCSCRPMNPRIHARQDRARARGAA